MLTRDQIRAKVSGKTISPQLIDPQSRRMRERAAGLLDIFNLAETEHWTRSQLDAALHDYEGLDTAHRLLKGMAKVLLDKCTFESHCPIDPFELRQKVFTRAAQTGPLALAAGPLGHRIAADVWRELAEELPTVDGRPWSVEALEASLYADLPAEQRLVERTGPRDPEALLHRYNVALVQALLLRARALTLRMKRPDAKRVRQLFRYLKFHQLMYRVSGSKSELVITVDGPQSLLRQSTRYGLQLAIFFPAVLLQPGAWSLAAEVEWGQKRKLRKQLAMSHEMGLKSHYRDRGAWTSNTEQWFVERFEKLETGWAVQPGQLLDLGRQQVLVPDLAFEKDGRVAYLDIVGFWRKSYLQKRLDETPPHVLLAVSKRLVGDKANLPKTLSEQVVLFAEVIPAKKVLALLEARAIKR